MRGKRTPAKQRAEAVGLAMVRGVPDAAKALGVSQRNIRRWKDDPQLSELVLSAREELEQTMRAAIWIGMDQIQAGLESSEEPLKDKASTVFGLIDRHQLLTGGPTSRSETVGSSLPPEVQRALRERFIEVTRDRADGLSSDVASESPPAGSVPTEG
jgi:hypothetical protein